MLSKRQQIEQEHSNNMIWVKYLNLKRSEHKAMRIQKMNIYTSDKRQVSNSARMSGHCPKPNPWLVKFKNTQFRYSFNILKHRKSGHLKKEKK